MQSNQRRSFFKHSIFGTIAIASGHSLLSSSNSIEVQNSSYDRYPSLDPEQVAAVVGAAHANFDKVKELVDHRPELANATWDWGFGDWETALGAASHMGRKDIAEYLIEHGARPDIYTYAMLGKLGPIQAMIEATPGVQKIHGPHGFTLLQHAKNRLRRKDNAEEDINNVNQVITYLESLGDADIKAKSLKMSNAEKEMYLGEYKFGTGQEKIFEVKLNMRKMLSVARKGTFGRALNKIDEHTFTVSGAPSVQIIFKVDNDQATSFSIHEPEPLVTAQRI